MQTPLIAELTRGALLRSSVRANRRGFGALTLIVCTALHADAQNVSMCGQTGVSVPLAGLGAKAGVQYRGDGLSLLPGREGARLRCAFQKLEGQATVEGLWLVSTADWAKGEPFRVIGASVGREADERRAEGGGATLARTGTVAVVENLARFVRPGLVEEYSASVDGVRQDFLVFERPGGEGRVRVELDLAGARAEGLAGGARLVLDDCGRKIAYSRLRAVDARGGELPARMKVASANCLAVLVGDAGAAYPLRIDPTFSDANWISMGGFPGASDPVNAAVVDGAGDLYIGDDFTVMGETVANRVAKWDGSAWSALGAGLNDRVRALAVSGTNLYVGGDFTTAGGKAANYVAKWDGSVWSALGSGLDARARALAVSGTDLCVGGDFATAGGAPANFVAKWDGSTWSALRSGLNNSVRALVVSGTDLYVGGDFTIAGGKVSAYLARANLATAPTLTITLTSMNTALISWPSLWADFTLHQNPDLNTTNWLPPAETVDDNGTVKSVIVNPPAGNRFYRLLKP